MCSKHDKNSRFNGQHNWGGPIRRLNICKNLDYDDEQDIYMRSTNYEAYRYMCALAFANHLALIGVFHILQEVCIC